MEMSTLALVVDGELRVLGRALSVDDLAVLPERG